IYELRREKLGKIHALGQDTYPHKFETTHTIPQILEKYSAKAGPELDAERVNVAVAGRIMSYRLMGKAGFMHLQQGGRRLQVYVRKDAVGERGCWLFQLLALGDYIGVRGYLFRTRTGELTFFLDELPPPTTALFPLPPLPL